MPVSEPHPAMSNTTSNAAPLIGRAENSVSALDALHDAIVTAAELERDPAEHMALRELAAAAGTAAFDLRAGLKRYRQTH